MRDVYGQLCLRLIHVRENMEKNSEISLKIYLKRKWIVCRLLYGKHDSNLRAFDHFIFGNLKSFASCDLFALIIV